MAVNILCKCDKCGISMPYKGEYNKIYAVWEKNARRVDLCKDCLKSFVAWLGKVNSKN